MGDDSNPPKTIFRRLRWAAVVAIGLLAFSGALFFFAGLLVNRIEIPQSQQRTPDYLAEGPAPTATPNATASPWGQPFAVALRAKSDDRPTSGRTPYALFLETELRDRPNLEGARQYLELDRIYHGNPAYNSLWRFYFNSNEGKALWQAGASISGEADQWLKTHAHVVAKFLNLAEGAGPPIRPMKLITQIEDPDSMPAMGFFMRIGVVILAGEGQRLFQAGDRAGADRFWLASIRLSIMYGLEPDYSGMYSVLIPVSCLENRIRGDIDRESLLHYRAALVSAHKLLFPADGHRAYWAWRIAARRKRLIAELNQPWHNSVFGWEYSTAGHYAEYHDSVAGLELPRIDRLAFEAVTAMSVKEQSTQIIRDFDVTYSEILRRLSATWPEIMAKEPFRWPEPPVQVCRLFYGEFFSSDSRDVPYFTERGRYFDERRFLRYKYVHHELEVRRIETALNLTRAAIECRLTTETQVAKIIPKQVDYESPWRDPFTEKPLRLIETSSGTLRVYSLGPDMIDQRGLVAFDAKKGIASGGDINLDITK